MNNGLVAQCGLSDEEMAQVRALAAACRAFDGVDVKFNYGMITAREGDSASDFCWFENGAIVGYAPLDRFGRKHELTAAVHPGYRRRGVFTQLFTEAVQEASRLESPELLLVGYRASVTGTAAIQKLGVPFKFAEYNMRAAPNEIVILPTPDVQLTDVTDADIPKLAELIGISFHEGGWTDAEPLRKELSDPERRYFLAMVNGAVVGQIGAIQDSTGTYIRAVGIVPEQRRKGYGRQMLSAVLRYYRDSEKTCFELDVATENEDALKLYTACGFRTSSIYDYYSVF